ncbi:MAG: hypothetical protein AAF515_16740 [Pseudomonadota bacterium]
MNGSDDASIGGIQVNTAGRDNTHGSQEKKRKRALVDQTTLDMLQDRLRRLEDNLERKYGENFAEIWAAELLDEETYRRAIAIKDQDKRREYIADEIVDGVASGEISADDVKSNPDRQEWLQQRDSIRNALAEHSPSSILPDEKLDTAMSESSVLADFLSNP